MTTAPLRAILVEPLVPAGLEPLLEHRPFALLPVGNRPLIEHLVAALAGAGVGSIRVLNARHTPLVSAALGDGSRWGVCIGVEQTDDTGAAWEGVRDATECDATVIALRMDLLVSGSDLRAAWTQSARTGLHGRMHGLGQYALPGFVLHAGEAAATVAPVPLVVPGAVRIDGLESYWRANLRAVRQHAAQHHPERRFGASTFVDAEAVINESAELQERCLVGARARLGARARVGSDSVIGEDVYLGDGVEIDESVILPGTLVGPHLHLRRKIVDGPCLIDVPTGAVAYVDDPLILGHLARGGSARAKASAADRVAAVAGLAAVALPALAWCAVRAVRGQRSFARQAVRLIRSRGTDGAPIFDETEVLGFAHARPDWARVPWLLAVLRGTLPLVATEGIPGPLDARFAATGRTRALVAWAASLARRGAGGGLHEQRAGGG